MACSTGSEKGKVVVDSIHGDIHLSDREVGVIDTASFQRLRRLKQLAMAQLVYPSATHTRFAHCLGALGTMNRILRVAKENGIPLREQQADLRLAALLHDVGHYPYSHLMETIGKVKLAEDLTENGKPGEKRLSLPATDYPGHEEVGRLIVTNQSDILDALGGPEHAKAVADLFTREKAADPQLSKLIHSSVDIDRLDYLLRDSYATGVPYGRIDINYLLNNLRVSPQGEVGFAAKALPAVEHLLLARFFMHRVVYYHKTIYGLEEACRQLLRRLRDREENRHNVPKDGDEVAGIVTGDGLGGFADDFVDTVVRKAAQDKDEVVAALARCVQNRRPPALIKEVQICEEKDRRHHAGSTFMQNCRSRLKELANHVGLPVGLFLVCQTRDLTVGDRLDHYTAQESMSLDPADRAGRAFEEEERAIKVFTAEDSEPVCLQDIPHSLVAKYTGYVFQAFRLYAICEGGDNQALIAELRQQTKDWDKPA